MVEKRIELKKIIKKVPEFYKQNKNLYLMRKNLTEIVNPSTSTSENHGILTIKITISNILINVTDIKGKNILQLSSGLAHYHGKERLKKYVIVNLIKNVLDAFSKLSYTNVSLHFKGVKKHRSLIINLLKKKLYFTLIKHNFALPHNGCRPRKTKRI